MAVLGSAALEAAHRLPAPIALLIGLAAVAAVAIPEIWGVVQAVDVIAHEGAHAMTCSGLGGRVTGVDLKANGNGRTVTSERPGTGVAIALAGYLGPSAFGVAAAALIAHGWIVAVPWAGVVLLAILLPSVRTTFGVAVVIGLGFVLFSVAHSGQGWLQALTAYALTWLLLLSGVRSVVHHGTGALDAGILRDKTRLPRGLWHGVWLVGSGLALVYGTSLLV